jgi:death-on-curing protein
VNGEPEWLKEAVVIAAHRAQILEHGGAPGIRDVGHLRSVLARPQNLLAYGESRPSVFDLAACYGFGLAKGHCFVDGNKRIALIATLTFLELHGWLLNAPREQTIARVLELVEGRVTEGAFSSWLAESCRRIDEWKEPS